MDKNEFEKFGTEAVQLRTASINELQNQAPRTLLRGLGQLDEMVHVYLDPMGHEIHVLRYVTVGAGETEQLLVLSHTQGPSGGVSSNAYFVSEKGHYPEFCDYEFCALLRSYGVSLRFTSIDPARHVFAKQHGGYAGPIWTPDLPRVTSLRAAVEVDSSKFEDDNVLRDLLQEACTVADVSFVIVNGDVRVAECDVAKAACSANALLSSMSLSIRQEPAEMMKAICTATMWGPFHGCMDNYTLEKGGNYVFSYMFDETSFKRDLPDVTFYDANTYDSALLGTYEGRPFLIVDELVDWDGIQGKVHVSLYGPADKFIADMAQRYKLVLTPKD